MRLDRFLTQNGYVNSRNKARELIRQGYVQVDQRIETKPSHKVQNPAVTLLQRVYVSRAARKLEGFLQSIGYDCGGMHCLDIGASTGGFVQVLLEMGAEKVTAVDVGRDQLDKSLRKNSKVVDLSPKDIRDFQSGQKFDLVTCDLSFISTQSVFDSIVHFAKKDMIVLFKPQFEVGRTCKRDSRGVLRDEKAVQEAIETFEASVRSKAAIKEKKQSTLKGKEGNVEYFYRFEKY